MKVTDLYSSVAQLGFETILDSTERFVYAVNRALLQVNRINPLTSIYKINHFPLKNVLTETNDDPICKDKEEIVFIAENVKSYSFECNGKGDMIIEKNEGGDNWATIGSVTLDHSGSFKRYAGLIQNGGEDVSGLVRLRFLGKYIYYVQNVAMYESLISDEVSDIPAYSKYTAYDVASLANDFISFAYPPIVDAKRDEGFVLNRDYFVEGEGKILLPASINGVFEICYNRAPTPITAESIDSAETIDLSPELCAILPNLVASYIWVEDEPDKAQYYLSLYREQVAEITAQKKDMRPATYRNKTGW